MNTWETLAEGEEKGFAVVLSEHPEVKLLWENRAELGGPVDINGVNPILHVMLEGTVENQLNDPELPEVGETLKRLMATGLSKHAARAVIANVLTTFFFDVLKNRKPFDKESYINRLSVLGADFSQTGRNEPCPCGSGMKFKRCCAEAAGDYRLSPMMGRLVLGKGYYFTQPDLPDIDNPLDPIYQLENRVHIAEYLVSKNKLAGAVEALNENIALAETYDEGALLENALYDMLQMCMSNLSLADDGLSVIERLLPLVEDEDEDKGNLLADKAEILARCGRVEEADKVFEDIFTTMPDWHYGRYRFALHLKETDRQEQARDVLQELVAAKGQIDAETYRDALQGLKQQEV